MPTMPHLFSSHERDLPPDGDEKQHAPEETAQDKENMWGRTWHKVGHWLKREDENEPPATTREEPEQLQEKETRQETQQPTRPSHSVVPGMPRPITFKRQDSERRERLYPHEPGHDERRAVSADRRVVGTSHLRAVSPAPGPERSSSPPKSNAADSGVGADSVRGAPHDLASNAATDNRRGSERRDDDDVSNIDWYHDDVLHHPEHLSEALDDLQLQSELEAKWILNLSMHFRDHSDREKFFITYAEEPNKWRRVTVSCDYRYAAIESLEADLKSLHYQRDKSARIYEAIRDSLPSIQFYSTVTNLKLQTSDGRLHVHVTEDANEIINYPHISTVDFLDLKSYPERCVEFDCHMSGFVYRVNINGRTYIKKEIPGPEAVEEFLYEINALSSLQDSAHVIRIEGLVVDDANEHVKGLLLSYCEQGALVDLIYDFRFSNWLSWPRRLRWARQVVQGLAEIHEAGFVQGDFTLSNIVVDANDDAFIIDINRRGCPIGWEPPELSRMIQAGQRIAMYIGVKSDLFQLGMVLWGLAEQQDEPERQERPLKFRPTNRVPAWYKQVVETCLNSDPKKRLPAKELLKLFPAEEKAEQATVAAVPVCPGAEYIDPATVVGLEDIDRKRAEDLEARDRLSAYAGTSASYSLVEAPGAEPAIIEPNVAAAVNRGQSVAVTQVLQPSLTVPSPTFKREDLEVVKEADNSVEEPAAAQDLQHTLVLPTTDQSNETADSAPSRPPSAEEFSLKDLTGPAIATQTEAASAQPLLPPFHDLGPSASRPATEPVSSSAVEHKAQFEPEDPVMRELPAVSSSDAPEPLAFASPPPASPEPMSETQKIVDSQLTQPLEPPKVANDSQAPHPKETSIALGASPVPQSHTQSSEPSTVPAFMSKEIDRLESQLAPLPEPRAAPVASPPPERTNTLNIRLPAHQDSGFDEPASAISKMQASPIGMSDSPASAGPSPRGAFEPVDLTTKEPIPEHSAPTPIRSTSEQEHINHTRSSHDVGPSSTTLS